MNESAPTGTGGSGSGEEESDIKSWTDDETGITHYYEVPDIKLTWEEAKTYCENQGGHLATIKSKKEDEFIFKNVVKPANVNAAWFGLKADTTGLESDNPLTETRPMWNWVNGEGNALDYSPWAADDEGWCKKNDQGNFEKYAMYFDLVDKSLGEKFANGGWNDNADYAANFICEWEEDSKLTTNSEWKDYLSQDGFNLELAKRLASYCKMSEDRSATGILSTYAQTGISDCYAGNYGEDTEFAYAIGTAKLDDTNIIVITFRGSTVPSEFKKDLTTGLTRKKLLNGTMHGGFMNKYSSLEVADDFQEQVIKGLNDYLDKRPWLENNKKKLKIIVTGHSLGGAGANLLAARLNICLNRGEFLSDIMSSKDVCAYTFGSINSILDYWYEETGLTANGMEYKEHKCDYDIPIENGFSNIHNVYNLQDSFSSNSYKVKMISAVASAVTYGGTSGNAFSIKGKFGHMHYFSKDYGEGLLDTTNHNMPSYEAALNEGLVKDCGVETAYDTHSVSACPTDIEVYKNGTLVGWIKNGEIKNDDPNVVMYKYDDVKHVFYSSAGGYEIKIIATDYGSMSYMVEGLSEENNGIKSFDNIEITKGDVFSSDYKNDITIDEVKLYELDSEGNKTEEIMTDGTQKPVNDEGGVLSLRQAALDARSEGLADVKDTAILTGPANKLVMSKLVNDSGSDDTLYLTVMKGTKFIINGDKKTFESQAKKIASVSSKGVVKAKSGTSGYVTIKYKQGGKQQYLNLRIIDPKVLKVSGGDLSKKGATVDINSGEFDIALDIPLTTKVGATKNKNNVAGLTFDIGNDGKYHLTGESKQKGKATVTFVSAGKKYKLKLNVL